MTNNQVPCIVLGELSACWAQWTR